MSINLEQFLQEKFNFSSFRMGQKEVITSVLAGKHTVAMLPTGTGKSLCYQFPGYLLKGQVLIVSPLLSLMQDQVEQLKMKGEKRVCALNSFLTPQQRTAVLSRLEQYKFIFISPEMLHWERILNHLKRLSLALFVVDEAHCISQWGYDFRPEYMKLGNIREELGNPLALSLTATATRPVIDDIIRSLRLPSWEEHIYSVDRENIVLKTEILADGKEKRNRLFELTESLQGPGIIYFSSRKLAEETALALKERGMQGVEAYHGNMDQESRILIQQQFINGQLQCICATSAFGMGINKDDVRYVIHYHMPLQAESYVQEIGRAGRDGGKSIAILLYAPGDEGLLTRLIEAELPEKEQLTVFIRFLAENPELAGEIGKYQHEICRLAGFTETQWRITEDFYRSRSSLSLKEFFTEYSAFIYNRRKFKQEKLLEMKDYVHTEDCRREKLLTYFGEKQQQQIEFCCDNCGFGMELLSEKSREEKAVLPLHSWQSRLKEILLGS